MDNSSQKPNGTNSGHVGKIIAEKRRANNWRLTAELLALALVVTVIAFAAAMHVRRPADPTAPPSIVASTKPANHSSPYVASKNSDLFHEVDCQYAKNIKQSNRITYINEASAVSDEKVPCNYCVD